MSGDNQNITNDELEYRADGRVEWTCQHGIGHTIYSMEGDFVHGCDGCCLLIKGIEDDVDG
jgi:hypothetical protein